MTAAPVWSLLIMICSSPVQGRDCHYSEPAPIERDAERCSKHLHDQVLAGWAKGIMVRMECVGNEPSGGGR